MRKRAQARLQRSAQIATTTGTTPITTHEPIATVAVQRAMLWAKPRRRGVSRIVSFKALSPAALPGGLPNPAPRVKVTNALMHPLSHIAALHNQRTSRDPKAGSASRMKRSVRMIWAVRCAARAVESGSSPQIACWKIASSRDTATACAAPIRRSATAKPNTRLPSAGTASSSPASTPAGQFLEHASQRVRGRRRQHQRHDAEGHRQGHAVPVAQPVQPGLPLRRLHGREAGRFRRAVAKQVALRKTEQRRHRTLRRRLDLLAAADEAGQRPGPGLPPFFRHRAGQRPRGASQGRAVRTFEGCAVTQHRKAAAGQRHRRAQCARPNARRMPSAPCPGLRRPGLRRPGGIWPASPSRACSKAAWQPSPPDPRGPRLST